MTDACLDGIFWVLRSGAPWRDLPDRYGPYTTCHNRFVRWRRAGVWDRILDAVADRAEASVQMIDSSIVRVHQHGSCIGRDARHCTGRSRGGLTTKIHAVVDRRGRPLRVDLSAGQEHDSVKAIDLLRDLLGKGTLLADKAYDADTIRAFAKSEGGWANIPPRGATARTRSASANTFTALEIRSVIQPDQAAPSDRNTLRQACRELSRLRQTGRRPGVVTG